MLANRPEKRRRFDRAEVLMELDRLEARKRYLMQSHEQYADLIEKYSRKPITLSNLYKFMKALERRVETNPTEKDRASRTGSGFMARLLVGKRDAVFLMKITEPFVKEKVLLEDLIKEIAEKRKVPQKEAIEILTKYIEMLAQKILQRKIPVVRACDSIEVPANQYRKAKYIEHDLVIQSLQTFGPGLFNLSNSIKRYKERKGW